MMKVQFTFTDSPEGSTEIHILTGCIYEVHDNNGNLILTGEGEIHEISPGQYCIYGSKYHEGGYIYFGEKAFEVPTDIPESGFQIWPPPQYDLNVIVYMSLVPIGEDEKTPCPEMWGDGSSGFLWILLVLFMIGGG